MIKRYPVCFLNGRRKLFTKSDLANIVAALREEIVSHRVNPFAHKAGIRAQALKVSLLEACGPRLKDEWPRYGNNGLRLPKRKRQNSFRVPRLFERHAATEAGLRQGGEQMFLDANHSCLPPCLPTHMQQNISQTQNP